MYLLQFLGHVSTKMMIWGAGNNQLYLNHSKDTYVCSWNKFVMWSLTCLCCTFWGFFGNKETALSISMSVSKE